MTLDGLDSSEAFVLLDDNLAPQGQTLLFQKPVEILRCDRPDEVPATLARIEALNAEGYYLAGSLSYELGYLFEPRLAALLQERLQKAGPSAPLIWMAAFNAPRSLDVPELEQLFASAGSFKTSTPGLSLSREDYIAKIGQVRDYIAAGDVYQINFTFKYNFSFSGNLVAFYEKLRAKQPVSYGAILHVPTVECDTSQNPGFDLLSLSPELFFQREDDSIWTRPMKGTAARGLDSAGDAAQASWLRNDEKSRAENLMIVDLLRNDIGRVSQVGSVEVTDLFTVETYRTVLQMTSGITARLQEGTGFQDIVRKIFPCGSITGAPKVRAMEIIHELESEARGVYTGAIGMIAPNGDCRFNVAIRTLMIEAAKDGAQDSERQGEMGIGSGIVYDSNPADEYDECLLKGRFLTDSMEDFELIETLLWQPGSGYQLLNEHLERLEKSALYFGFPHDRASVQTALETAAAGLPRQSHRVRLLLDSRGKLTVTSTAIAAPDSTQTLNYVISEHRVDSRDPFFRHKTTRRQLYDSDHARLSAATGCDEVLFLNERDEVAEGSRTNVFIERAGHLITPPLSCGVLAGTLRQSLLDDPAVEITEAVLTLHDLETADRVLFGNSVRGLQEARALSLVQQDDPTTAALQA